MSQLDSLDATERERWGVLVADAWGLMAAGAEAPGLRAMLAASAELGDGDIAVPYTPRTWSPQGAATAASALIHAWDFDDTHDTAVVHTAAIAVPAALAAAQRRDASGRSFADGIVVGVQALSRLGGLVGPRAGVIRTAGLGAPAAAAAAAATWGLDRAGIENAMSLAVGVSLAPGSRQAVVDSSLAKRVQPGLAVQAGLYAAALALNGVEGPRGWLTGDHGLLPGADVTVADVLDGPFAGAELAIKPYPACRYGHAAIAAAEQLYRAHGSQADDKLVVRLPEGASYAMVARPYADRGEPIIDAQFSVPWQVASIWTSGRYDVATLAGPDVVDPVIASAARAVEVRQDLPASTVMSGATVELHRAGVVHVAESPMPGGPEAPLDRSAVDAKIRSCLTVAGLDPDAESRRIWELVDGVADLSPADLRRTLTEFAPARQTVA
ncbi:hypothetical protein GEV29_03230 [Aeromicrobium sp. SMF47]|uniref:MmgE/PrpD family protein n=1 Tax=Aeromicrobium yanjiei TaxID=2662028 RepID=UPI00129EC8CD|nr:MmgE/PrpD family protein [Aeromicrobium yanjiei]MRJ75538.1 hypothetical protein [Aeromicrobium yanjiei]